jgi:hypothetical protein
MAIASTWELDMPYLTVVAGTTITASWGNQVRDQLVTPFASTSARTSAITSPVEGMLSYLTDGDNFEGYDGTAWRVAASIGAWTTFTPSWTALSANPSLNNGSMLGRYRYLSWKLIVAEYRITFGSTTTGGTGVYFLTSPVTASVTAADMSGGTWHALDSGTQEYGGPCKFEDTSKFRMVLGAGGSCANNSPFTFSTNDTIRAQVFFEPA